MRISREYETPLLLGLACTLLAVVVLAEWLWKSAVQRSWRATIADQGTAAAVPPAQVPTRVFELPARDRFSGIVERPIFVQGRRPVAAEDAGPAEPEKPFEAQLHGIVTGPDGVLVLLKDKAGHNYKLRENDKLDGWVLSEIGQDRVVMKRGDAKRELKLQKPKPKEAAKAPPPPPANSANDDEETQQGGGAKQGDVKR